eukprot:TRINITY_DN44899_c0_g1_i1.p1 TRINITY_DN44899_c0_g1~~TRINITY_DN44899_c0_g1_i1.p1  ORF type:complete len:102 (+),score=5.47 TRINITY_DN44899_c0_g1_i1:821-1126(+)
MTPQKVSFFLPLFSLLFLFKGTRNKTTYLLLSFFTIVTTRLSRSRSFKKKQAIRIIQGCSDCILISGSISCSFHKQLHLLMQPDWRRDLPKSRHLEANTNT